MKITTFRVLGAPLGKARPRITRNGTFTPKRTRDYERAIRQAWQDAGGITFGAAPVIVEAVAVFEPPKSLSRKKRLDLIDRGAPTKKPDADNVAKIILDGLNKVAWDDDTQVVDVMVTKRYAEDPLVAVIIEEIDAKRC